MSPSSPLAVRARGLGVRSRSGRMFGGVDLDLAEGGLLVVTGPSGSGKTAFALTVAGRMRPTVGELAVLGLDLPRRAGAVRSRVGLAADDTVAPLDDTLSVQHHVAEAVVLAGPWWRPATTRRRVDEVLATADGLIDALGAEVSTAEAAARLPHLSRDTRVADLLPLPRLVLRVVLALLARPDLLVVEDLDALRDTRERRLAWHGLARLRTSDDRPLSIVVTCQDPRDLDAAATGGRPITVLDLAAARDSVDPEAGPEADPDPESGAAPAPAPAPAPDPEADPDPAPAPAGGPHPAADPDALLLDPEAR